MIKTADDMVRLYGYSSPDREQLTALVQDIDAAVEMELEGTEYDMRGWKEIGCRAMRLDVASQALSESYGHQVNVKSFNDLFLFEVMIITDWMTEHRNEIYSCLRDKWFPRPSSRRIEQLFEDNEKVGPRTTKALLKLYSEAQ